VSCLLDTHTLLWALLEPSKLTPQQRRIIESSDKEKCMSTISIWEISLKFSLGKLNLGGHTPEEFLKGAQELGFRVVIPTPEHYASFHQLPSVVKHKDPFDRMLIWQAIQDGLTLLSSDGQLPNYKIHGLKLT